MTIRGGTPRTVIPALRLRGELRLPGDKSIAHRALIANALAAGSGSVALRRPGEDVLSTVACLRQLGVEVEAVETGAAVTFHVGDGPLTAPARPLSCRNSGTTMRLLAGALAGLPITATLDGDGSLRRRPMARLAHPLGAMGALVETDGGRPPLRVAGRRSLAALTHSLPVASAQLLGAIAFAALGAAGRTAIVAPGPTRDHTERLLAWLGVPIVRSGNDTLIDGPARPSARAIVVPGDPSAAAAWLVAAAIHPDAEIRLCGVGLNPTRLAMIDVLREMGADVSVEEDAVDGPEPIGTLVARSTGRLQSISINGERVAALIDELPLLGIAMASADGRSELRDAGELRVKESDRIVTMVAGLAAIGARVDERRDGWRIAAGRARDAAVATNGDHRVAIAFAVAALGGVAGSVTLDDADCCGVSYPTFFDDLATVSGQAVST